MARSTLQNVCHRGRKRYQVVDRPQFASAYAIEIPGMKYIKILSIEIENKYLFGKIISWNVNLQKNFVETFVFGQLSCDIKFIVQVRVEENCNHHRNMKVDFLPTCI